MGAHLHSLCAQHECRRHSASVRDPACGDHRNAYRVHDLRYQYHGGILTNMPACLAAFRYKSICSAALHTFGEGDRSNHGNHFYSRIFPHFHVFLRIAGSGRHHFDAFFYDNLCYLISVRTHKHDVYAKWLICQLLCFTNLLSYPVSRRTRGSDKAKAASVRHTCRQMIFGNPCHAALNDRIFDS